MPHSLRSAVLFVALISRLALHSQAQATIKVLLIRVITPLCHELPCNILQVI